MWALCEQFQEAWGTAGKHGEGHCRTGKMLFFFFFVSLLFFFCSSSVAPSKEAFLCGWLFVSNLILSHTGFFLLGTRTRKHHNAGTLGGVLEGMGDSWQAWGRHCRTGKLFLLFLSHRQQHFFFAAVYLYTGWLFVLLSPVLPGCLQVIVVVFLFSTQVMLLLLIVVAFFFCFSPATWVDCCFCFSFVFPFLCFYYSWHVRLVPDNKWCFQKQKYIFWLLQKLQQLFPPFCPFAIET